MNAESARRLLKDLRSLPAETVQDSEGGSPLAYYTLAAIAPRRLLWVIERQRGTIMALQLSMIIETPWKAGRN